MSLAWDLRGPTGNLDPDRRQQRRKLGREHPRADKRPFSEGKELARIGHVRGGTAAQPGATFQRELTGAAFLLRWTGCGRGPAGGPSAGALRVDDGRPEWGVHARGARRRRMVAPGSAMWRSTARWPRGRRVRALCSSGNPRAWPAEHTPKPHDPLGRLSAQPGPHDHHVRSSSQAMAAVTRCSERTGSAGGAPTDAHKPASDHEAVMWIPMSPLTARAGGVRRTGRTSRRRATGRTRGGQTGTSESGSDGTFYFFGLFFVRRGGAGGDVDGFRHERAADAPTASGALPMDPPMALRVQPLLQVLSRAAVDRSETGSDRCCPAGTAGGRARCRNHAAEEAVLGGCGRGRATSPGSVRPWTVRGTRPACLPLARGSVDRPDPPRGREVDGDKGQARRARPQ